MKQEFASLILFLLIVGVCVLLLWFFIFKVKHLKTSNVYFVDGGVKTGKSLLCVMLAIKQYRKNLISYYVGNVLIRFFNLFRVTREKYNQIVLKNGICRRKIKRKLQERPMLYSNMPLYKVKYNPLSTDIIQGKVRIPYKSVCILDEATLIADSMMGLITDKSKRKAYDETNEALTLFLKLFGHATHNGFLVFNSQNVVDLHFSFKRCTSSYLYLTKNRKFPFFCLVQGREIIHDESNDMVNVNTGDIDDSDKPIFVSKRWYKYYDRFYLDVLYKELPLYVDYDVKKVHPLNKIQIKQIVTLGNYQAIRDYNAKMQKDGAN